MIRLNCFRPHTRARGNRRQLPRLALDEIERGKKRARRRQTGRRDGGGNLARGEEPEGYHWTIDIGGTKNEKKSERDGSPLTQAHTRNQCHFHTLSQQCGFVPIARRPRRAGRPDTRPRAAAVAHRAPVPTTKRRKRTKRTDEHR